MWTALRSVAAVLCPLRAGFHQPPVRPVVVGPHCGDSRDAELLPPDDKLRVHSMQ